MKRPVFALLLTCFIFNFCDAQIYKSIAPSPEFGIALQKIVLDFRNNFSNIQGNNISEQGEADLYESTIKLPGALECVIYNFHSKADTTASWQGIMYRGDDYREASRTYENVFRIVKKSQVKWIDKSYIGFSGTLEKPSEDLRFKVSTLRFLLDDNRYKKFSADVEIVSTYDGWEVRLNLQTRKEDSDPT